MEKDSSETCPIQPEVLFVPRQEWSVTIEGQGRSSGAPQNTQILWSSSLSGQTTISGIFAFTLLLLGQCVGLCGYRHSRWTIDRVQLKTTQKPQMYTDRTQQLPRDNEVCAAIEAKKPIRMLILQKSVKQEMSQVVWSIFWIPSAALFLPVWP